MSVERGGAQREGKDKAVAALASPARVGISRTKVEQNIPRLHAALCLCLSEIGHARINELFLLCSDRTQHAYRNGHKHPPPHI